MQTMTLKTLKIPYSFIEYKYITAMQDMHTVILNMCVLLPFGVNNPASLVTFSIDKPYDTESEYMKQVLFLNIAMMTDQKVVP